MTKDISKVIIPHVCITALLYLQGLLGEITGNIRCISADISKVAVNIQCMSDFRYQQISRLCSANDRYKCISEDIRRVAGYIHSMTLDISKVAVFVFSASQQR